MKATITEWAIAVDVNGEQRIIGKLIYIVREKLLVFYRHYKWGNAYFRKWDALSFDARVVKLFKANPRIEQVHYEDDLGSLFFVPVKDYLENAILGEHGEGEQLYLPLGLWAVAPERDYFVAFTNKIHVIK